MKQEQEIERDTATIGAIIMKPGQPSQEELAQVGVAALALLSGFLINIARIADALESRAGA